MDDQLPADDPMLHDVWATPPAEERILYPLAEGEEPPEDLQHAVRDMYRQR
ncbi:hypothetical protein [Nonomuraea sp. NPDC023979]|uniref:hypothetical protein n=1 Tax=Nonomuraea sp. NPDC023979 TaxID=3154796 RepID=UPI003409EBA5